jgi:hypothetical protein
MELPQEIIEYIACYTDMCTTISFRLTCHEFSSLQLNKDNELWKRVTLVGPGRRLSSPFRTIKESHTKRTRIYTYEACAYMGYENLYFDLIGRDIILDSGVFHAACIGGSLRIALSCQDKIINSLSVLLCAIYNSEEIYTNFLSKVCQSYNATEIHATGRSWLNNYYKSKKRVTQGSFQYAITYHNYSLIHDTVPKNLSWGDVIDAKYLKEEDNELYNSLIERAYRNGNHPGVITVMKLNDVDVYKRWNTRHKDYRTVALSYFAYNILSFLEIEGSTMLECCQNAWGQGCILKDHNLIFIIVQLGNLQCIKFIFNCLGEDFFRSSRIQHKPKSDDSELHDFLTELFPYLYR